ncbi:hypothetical protein K438DRAFT_964186 [Mycena galopus ATCC 62051]|nr:hypothetical protein K438DRAFT_964186 [Mycena galopus ATCC 62051]
MSTSGFSKSTGTRNNLPSGLTRLSNETVPVLRLAKESVASSGIPGPEAALGGVLTVAEMIQDMQSNKDDLAKLKPHLEELIKIDMSGCDAELKKRLTELGLKLELLLDKCESLAAESGIKRIMRGKKYKEQIQSLRDDIASHIQEFTFDGSISIEKLVNTVEHVKKTVDEAKAEFKEVQGTVNETKTTHYRGSDFQIVNNHIYGGKGGSGGGGGIQGYGGAGGAGEGPTLQIAYTAGSLTINNLPAGPAVGHAAQKAEFKELKGTVDETKGQQLIAKLRYVSAHHNAENTPEKCLSGTRKDLINNLITCLTCLACCSDGSQRIVMLSGSAGSGKSTIAKTIAIELEKQKCLAASFFFSWNYQEHRLITSVPVTLAYQLACYSSSFRDLLVKILDENPKILGAAAEEQFEHLVVGLLAEMPSCTTPWIICLDALDECEKDHQQDCGQDCRHHKQDHGQIFLGWLSDSINRIPGHIRFFLTGHPDVPSYLRHDHLSSMMHRVLLDEIDKSTVSKDIRLYIHHNLDGSTWKPKDLWKAQRQDVDVITYQADGLFIYAATAVRYIQQRSPKIPPAVSMKHLKSGLGNDLNHLYFQIVNEAIPNPGTDAACQEQYQHSMEVLGTLFNLLEPLDLHALGNLLNMQRIEIENILTPLESS